MTGQGRERRRQLRGAVHLSKQQNLTRFQERFGALWKRLAGGKSGAPPGERRDGNQEKSEDQNA
jgi:hypothetical protein